MPEIVCENRKCGKKRHMSPRAYASAKHHFCSRQCYWEWRRGKYRKKYVCKRCGKKVEEVKKGLCKICFDLIEINNIGG